MATRGELRVYLGAAPGVGKTYRMLDEAHRRRDRGADVVIGFVECHGRVMTEAMVDDLETVPRRRVSHRGTAFEEMDLEAVLRRRPQVVLVDELAHTNVPGAGGGKRWQDIEVLLEAGVTVLSTLNIQHLESLNDVVEQITGVRQRETVPDAWVRGADQIELVDMTPEALRRRLAHGNVYAPEKIDASLGNYFRTGNLSALRELALLWLAGRVDAELEKYRYEHGVTDTWEARERVVVALTGGPEGETLIRRAARIAQRGRGADLLAVHVARSDGLTGADPALLARQRLLAESLGGTYHQVLGEDVPRALIAFARGVNATQLVLGASRRGRVARMFSPGIGATTAALSGPIDVHLVTHEQVGMRVRARTASPVSRRRRLAACALALTALVAVGFVMGLPSDEDSLASGVVLVFATVTVVALVGGLWPALLASVCGTLLLDLLYTEPYLAFTVARPQSLIALAGFVVVAVSVSLVVDQAARRTREAAQAGAEAQLLATVAGNVLRGSRPLEALMERLLETFSFTSVALLERRSEAAGGPGHRADPRAWAVVASAAREGAHPCPAPAGADIDVPVDDRLTLVVRGPEPEAGDRRVIEAFAAQAAVALRQERLAREAATVKPLAEADRMRTALLSAVSHDLRAPLASAKASVTSLRSREVDFGEEDREGLLALADESLDRLTRLVTDLLDMSRLQAGVLGVGLEPLALRESVFAALAQLGPEGAAVRVEVPGELPDVRADPGLLDRVLANVVGNAVRFSPAGRPPSVSASWGGDTVEVLVADHGPGVPEEDRERMFVPFQRFGDTDNETGLGLGLALSQGFAEAMGGSLAPESTPGGGLTMRLVLRTAAARGPEGAPPAE
ncbi:two-component system, OmpR family, sensor histidine kinase KdpD [Nocardiopsis flavescens]|uniref:histidine kinase n=1 Tax=Nocardiopsis flavescens TaxID=758803 RepID=A0A1M6L460_9ACTN|nr:ATP-binding protein [Nocardiopsis flavescens]SHJ65976.1 two-component system, OmpR family, sensor histidine kinase KdpD [Nocardiopsis flavescens]